MIGRFISADSLTPDIFNPQYLNRYAYCFNNPLIYIDPSGHVNMSRVEGGGGSGGFGGFSGRIGGRFRTAPTTTPNSNLNNLEATNNLHKAIAAANALKKIQEAVESSKAQGGENDAPNVSDGQSTPGTPDDPDDNTSGKTNHGSKRSGERGFSDEKIEEIKSEYSQKVYQSGGRTVFAKKSGKFYDVVVTNKSGKVITTVGGNTRSLRTWKDVTKMLKNQGGYSSLPWN